MTIVLILIGGLALALTVAALCSTYAARTLAAAWLAYASTRERATRFLREEFWRLYGEIVRPEKKTEKESENG